MQVQQDLQLTASLHALYWAYQGGASEVAGSMT